jgi:predicted transcriptional regulator
MPDLLNIVTTSEKRKKLLLLLQNGPCTWEEIKTSLNVTASGMLPQIRILEDKGLVIKEAKTYSLTDIGFLVAYHLKPFDQTLTVLEQQKKFWQEHDTEALPKDLLIRIGDLKNAHIIESSVEESFEPHNQFLEMILHSEKVAGISPIVHPVYPKFFLGLAKDGRNVQLILTRNAYNKIKKEYFTMLLDGLRFRNAHLWICDEDARFAFIVTDKYFSMGLFLKNGIFDSKRDIVSSDPSAITWGEDLFAHYLACSHPVNTEGSY